MNERREYERGGFTNLSVNLWLNQFTLGLYTSSLNPLQQHAQRYEAATQAVNDYLANNPNPATWTENQRTEFARLNSIADQHLETFREARAATADLAANALATAAGILVVVASGGTATPLIVALAAGAGGATQALTRMGLDGVFNFEELPADLLLGAVNAGTAALSFPANVAGGSGVTFGVLRRVAGSAFGGGAIGGALPVVMSEETWREGLAVGTLRVSQGALVGGLASTVLPATIGASVIFARRALPFVRWTTTYTSTVASYVFDAAWVRSGVSAIRANTQTVKQYLVATLTGWENKGREIAQRILQWTAQEPESVLRQRIADLLEVTGWNAGSWRWQWPWTWRTPSVRTYST